MKYHRYPLLSSLLTTLGVFCLASSAAAQRYKQTNLVSDTLKAPITDSNLVNPWGIAHSPTGPWWVADNGTDVATLYDGMGKPFPGGSPLVVTLSPPPGGVPPPTLRVGDRPTSPTGIVFNGTTDFVIAPGPAEFILVTERTMFGWSSATPNQAHLEVNHSIHSDVVYTGATIAMYRGANYLFVANFRGPTVDVFDTRFTQITPIFRDGKVVQVNPGAFTDPSLPPDFAPFNVQNINGNIYVTFAKQNTEKNDSVDGPGLGYVVVFDTAGNLVYRLESGYWLNAPWGVVLAPANFGKFSNDVLVGQFGSGHIAAFNPSSGNFEGLLLDVNDRPITINGLRGIGFGNDALGGSSATLYFTAGTNNQKEGLFGKIEAY